MHALIQATAVEAGAPMEPELLRTLASSRLAFMGGPVWAGSTAAAAAAGEDRARAAAAAWVAAAMPSAPGPGPAKERAAASGSGTSTSTATTAALPASARQAAIAAALACTRATPPAAHLQLLLRFAAAAHALGWHLSDARRGALAVALVRLLRVAPSLPALVHALHLLPLLGVRVARGRSRALAGSLLAHAQRALEQAGLHDAACGPEWAGAAQQQQQRPGGSSWAPPPAHGCALAPVLAVLHGLQANRLAAGMALDAALSGALLRVLPRVSSGRAVWAGVANTQWVAAKRCSVLGGGVPTRESTHAQARMHVCTTRPQGSVRAPALLELLRLMSCLDCTGSGAALEAVQRQWCMLTRWAADGSRGPFMARPTAAGPAATPRQAASALTALLNMASMPAPQTTARLLRAALCIAPSGRAAVIADVARRAHACAVGWPAGVREALARVAGAAEGVAAAAAGAAGAGGGWEGAEGLGASTTATASATATAGASTSGTDSSVLAGHWAAAWAALDALESHGPRMAGGWGPDAQAGAAGGAPAEGGGESDALDAFIDGKLELLRQQQQAKEQRPKARSRARAAARKSKAKPDVVQSGPLIG